MTLEVRVHAMATKSLKSLPTKQRRRLMSWKAALEKDPTAGVRIQRKKIPTAMRSVLEEPNLWRLTLPDAWRALYSIQVDAGQRIVLLLFIGTHRQYEKLMGYKTR